MIYPEKFSLDQIEKKFHMSLSFKKTTSKQMLNSEVLEGLKTYSN